MIETIVARCVRRPWLVIAFGVVLTGLSFFYVVTHFAITTDTNKLISSKVSYRQDEIAFAQAFPQTQDLIVAVINTATPEAAENAAGRLVAGLAARPDIFRFVRQPETLPFFAKNGLLLLPQDRVAALTRQIEGAAPLIGALERDPTLRGLARTITGLLTQGAGGRGGNVQMLSGVAPLFTSVADTLQAVLDGDPAQLSWQNAFTADSAARGDNHQQIVLAQPVLDYNALEPGAQAIGVLRQIAADAGVTADNGIELRLTGPVPLADEEFATVAQNAGLNGALTVLAIAVLLILALRSGRLILSVLGTLVVGLVVTFALGLLLVGELNLISVAFAVLFIGLGVDFGIQLSTRYRAERFAAQGTEGSRLQPAILSATRAVGLSLTLAAASLLAGFFSFLPTQFRGVSELGLIAGIGMIVAYVASLTVLPALMTVMRLPEETRPLETRALARVDHFIAGHRTLLIALTVLATLAGVPSLVALRFDSNPMNLRSQTVESVATFLDLSRKSETAPNKLEVLVQDEADIAPMVTRLDALPEVARTVSLATFLPQNQAEKLGLIQEARAALQPVFAPDQAAPAPADEETVAALSEASKGLAQASDAIDRPVAGAMKNLGQVLGRLVDASPEARERAQGAVFEYFPQLVANLKTSLSAETVTRRDLPAELVTDWVATDGRARIEISPTGDSNDNAVLQRFADVVRTVAPNASGPPIGITEAGKVIVRAFLQAGLFALVAITIILWIALRRLSDVVLALGPLVLAGFWTLEFSSAIGLPLNFANIIALPLMFGVGVAFHIYYLIAWRSGVADVLASSLTRAIFFSALTTGTAFGSLWASSHPGTSSMGELLAISLVFTLIAAFLVVPAFLGPPPKPSKAASPSD